MKKIIYGLLLFSVAISMQAENQYTPSPENLESRRNFANDRFGIFIHWGIYSMFGQGEWYLNYGPLHSEYSKAAGGFYPANFDAGKWADIIKNSGARYVTFTSRHHDGFSMWNTKQSPYNIVEATPFRRDILKELSDSLRSRDINLHLYYSHLDWGREDYPQGRTGHTTGRDSLKSDWPAYYDFMNRQLTELLTEYGPIRAIWFDGWWDHDEDLTPFDWQLPEQYAMIHNLQPGCLVGNNHHQMPFEGEDIQIFERDVPGENTAGYAPDGISRLPLETCQTMNGMWGYKVVDTNYKSVTDLIRLLVRTAGKGANLLLNVGPQPDGNLPQVAIERLSEMGQWLRKYGKTIYGTQGAPFPEQEWGTATLDGDNLYLHILRPVKEISVPVEIASATYFDTGQRINFRNEAGNAVISLPENLINMDEPDLILTLTL